MKFLKLLFFCVLFGIWMTEVQGFCGSYCNWCTNGTTCTACTSTAYWYGDIGLCSMTACLHPDYNASNTNGGIGACSSISGGNLDPTKAIPTSVLVAVIVCCILGYLACVGILLFCIMNYKKRQQTKEDQL